MDGKLLIRQLEAIARNPRPDAGAIRDKLAVFGQSLTEAGAVVDKEKKGKNANALYEGGYEQLLTHAGWYKDSIGTLLRHLDEAASAKKAYRKEDRQRDMEEIIKMYNSMVDQSNNVGYSSAMK